MWRFKPFMPKEQTGLEGRVIDIGNFKVQIRNAIAEGGFSCVYLARDAIHGSKQYALKHIICNDEESRELVMKEVAVMKSLKGHPNVVTLYADAIFDMGRTIEAFLLMEYCERSLVNVLESRGAGFFEEKQILTIFRDVCNAVFAMHCQSPPIAHRDLKAENLLLGSDRLWKLCDFGSTSTKHKRFEKPEEMGIEEDNIRKHTTPAYRAPELWDLFRRDLINEKVDIWALGCLLFRISYFKLAFDGESKLQILNGNYRIPELPKYSTSLTDLIREMLQSSPDDRPDITQVWYRVNDLLPDGLQKSLPDRPPGMPQQNTDILAGMPKPENKSNPMPRRSAPPPPSTESSQNASSVSNNPKPVESTALFGAFWATLQANDSEGQEEINRSEDITSHKSNEHAKTNPHSQNAQRRSVDRLDNGPAKDLKVNLFPDDLNHNTEVIKPSKPDGTSTFQNDAYNSFFAEFSNSKQTPGSNSRKSGNELEAEVEKLKEKLTRISKEKEEITFKFEKLSAICRSQGQEIQDLKQAITSRAPTGEKVEGTVLQLKDNSFGGSLPRPDTQQWQAFSDDLTSVKTRNIQQNKQVTGLISGANVSGFGSDNFKAVPSANSKRNVVGESKNSQCSGESKSMESKFDSQPAGWAGF